MNRLRKILNTWCYLGYDKETLKEYEVQLAKDNLHMFPMALSVAAVITLLEIIFTFLFAVSGKGETKSLFITMYALIITAVAIIVTGVCFLAARNSPKVVRNSRIFTTVLLSFWSLLYIVLGSCINPDDYAVIACGLFLLVQIMFNAYPKDNLIFVGCAYLLFVLLCFLNKSTMVFVYDMLDSFPFLAVGLLLSWIKSRSKWASFINADAMVQLKTQRLENELLQSQVAVMLSQIQPHFLYNSLMAIKALCRTNPELAESVTVEFSNYLRGNLDSISAKNPVRFEQELEHTRIFLKLEKLQYGDKLAIIYDIRADSFMIPTLTIQPIAENAVKYGFKKKESMTVKISSFEDDDGYYVTVEDDGPGFDTDETLDATKSHIGINNVRNRLEIQTGSTLEIESVIGVGTRATVRIPKNREVL